MNLEVSIVHVNAIARFIITKEAPGIYTADLIQFEGNFRSTLPKKITLTKGIRGWSGSINDKALLEKLGNLIDVT